MLAILNLKTMTSNINLSKISIKTCDYQQCLNDIQHIRRVVFIEEQKVPVELEWDGLDEECIHFLAYYNNKAIATARLLSDGHIGRMAVLPAFRRQKVGHKLLKFIIALAKEKSLKIRLSAQAHAVDFYVKHDFHITSNVYMDAGIPHFDMEYENNEETE